VADTGIEFADLATEIANGGGSPLNPRVRLVDRLCAQTLELLLRTTGYNDDITLLATQRCTPTPPLCITADAPVLASHMVRTRFRGWLSTVGADPTDSSDLLHAISEFVENAAQHAYPIEVADGIMIEAMLDGFGNVQASVTDHGQWREHHAGDVQVGRGQGLALAEALVDQVRVTHNSHETTAALTRRLSRPAKFVTHPRLGAIIETKPRGGEFVTTANNAGHIVIAGDIDSRAASTLGQQIAIQSRAGTAPLTINLGAVTHLGRRA
jgi:anti-sigma regulatory factor (Ser/Thr protein kinase)